MTQEKYFIREATIADLDDVVRLQKHLSDAHAVYDATRYIAPPDIADVYAQWLRRANSVGDMLTLLVSDNNAKAHVGFLIAEACAAEPENWSGPYAYIHDIFLLPDAQGCGMGQRLLDEAIQWAHRLGYPQIRGLVAGNNANGLAFFQKHGFRPAGIEVCLDLPAEISR